MSLRNLTWQQVIVCVALLVAVVAAYKILGELPAGLLLVLSGIINLLLGRNPPKPPSDGNGVAAGTIASALAIVALGAATQACGAGQLAADGADLESLSATLAKCRAEGRDAGTYAAYEGCKKREGVEP